MSIPDFRTLMAEALGTIDPPPPEGETDARILDATLKLIGEYGERRFTIDDIAEEARVARATVFRRFGSKDGVISRLYGREVRAVMTGLFARTRDADGPAAAITDGFLFLLAHAAGHPITSRLARAEPDILVDIWRDGDPSGQEVLVTLLTTVAAQHEQDLDRRAVETLADLLARLLFAELLVAGTPARARARRAAVSSLVEATLSSAGAR